LTSSLFELELSILSTAGLASTGTFGRVSSGVDDTARCSLLLGVSLTDFLKVMMASDIEEFLYGFSADHAVRKER